MSVHAMSAIFKHSEAVLLERLILLCHADHAHGAEPPWHSFAGVALVAHETRASRKGVQAATKRLVKSGRLKDTGERRGGTPVYEVIAQAAADVADREHRLAREEKERKRNRKGAKQVRPSDDGADQADGGEVATPHTGEAPTPPGAEAEGAGAASTSAGAASTSPEPVGTPTDRAAANAAAAGAPASGGSSIGPDGDVAARFWADAAATLVAAGFSVDLVEDQAPKIKAQLRRYAHRLPSIAWDVLALQLREGRRSRDITMWEWPAGTLAFGLGQTIGDHLPAQRKPPKATAAAPTPTGAVSDRLEIEAPDDVAVKWRELVDGLRETQWWAERGERQIGSWLDAVVPVALDGDTLTVTGKRHALGWVEEHIVPVLDRYAQDRMNGAHVRFVDRETAARRTAA